jgi:hypothetical protein
MSVYVSFREKRRKLPVPLVLVKQASGASPDRIHASVMDGETGFLQGLCYNSASKLAFPSRRRLVYGDQFQGERLHFASFIRRPHSSSCVHCLIGITG